MKQRIDPRVKLLLTISMTVVAFLVRDFWVLASLFTGVLAVVVMSKIPISYGIKVLKLPALFILLMVIVDGFLTIDGRVLIGVGIFQLTTVSLIGHLLTFMRLAIVILSMVILMKTTKSYGLMLAIEAFLSPIRKLGIPTDGFLLTLKIVSRFVPTLFIEAQKILNAQASRGLDIKDATLSQKIKRMTALFIPVFVISMKRGEQLADAMLVRGYVLNGGRTSYRTLQRDV